MSDYYDDDDDACDDDAYDDDADCTTCGGEGELWGDEMNGDAGFYLYDQMYPCWNCNGSGRRYDQRVF